MGSGGPRGLQIRRPRPKTGVVGSIPTPSADFKGSVLTPVRTVVGFGTHCHRSGNATRGAGSPAYDGNTRAIGRRSGTLPDSISHPSLVGR